MVELIVATRNHGKVRELQALASGLDLKLRSLDELQGPPDPPETGSTFKDNAIIKARAAAAATGSWAIGDDSGLCVDALGGGPGILSARYAEGGDQTRWQKLLFELRSMPDDRRDAEFVCALALVAPGGATVTTEGRCAGRIGRAPRGDTGFGYDPIFVVAADPQGRTMAELSEAEKNVLSHRGRAFELMRPHLRRLGLTAKPTP